MKGLFGTLGLSGKTYNAGNFIIFDADIYIGVTMNPIMNYNDEITRTPKCAVSIKTSNVGFWVCQ